jgi:DNA-binding response OmpR family regulator
MIKILLVEDTPSLATEIIDIFKMERFAVDLAVNGRDALNQMKLYVPDIVVSDLFMPEMDGFQLIEAMKKDVRFRTVPIIIFSARTTTETIEKVRSLGSDLFIQKPCDSAFLVNAIKKIIKQKQQVDVND